MPNALTAKPSVDHLPEELLLKGFSERLSFLSKPYVHSYRRPPTDHELNSPNEIDALFEQIKSKNETDAEHAKVKLDRLYLESYLWVGSQIKKQKNTQGLEHLQKTLEHFKFAIDQFSTKEKERRDKAAQEEEAKKDPFYQITTEFDSAIDKSSYFLKFVISILRIILRDMPFAKHITKIVSYSISLIRETWTGLVAYSQKSQFQREVTMKVSFARALKAIASLIFVSLLFAIYVVSKTVHFVNFLLTAFNYFAGIGKDIKFFHENRTSLKDQEAKLQDAINNLETFKKTGMSKHIIETQKALIKQLQKECKKTKQYSLQNRLRLSLDSITVTSVIITLAVIAGCATMPHVVFAGLLMLSIGMAIKYIEKQSNNWFSKFFSPLFEFKPKNLPHELATENTNTAQPSDAPFTYKDLKKKIASALGKENADPPPPKPIKHVLKMMSYHQEANLSFNISQRSLFSSVSSGLSQRSSPSTESRSLSPLFPSF